MYNFQQLSATYQQRYSNKEGPPYQFCLVFLIIQKCFILKVSTANQVRQLYFSDEAIFRSRFIFLKHGQSESVKKAANKNPTMRTSIPWC